MACADSIIRKWLNSDTFADFLKNEIIRFDKIINFTARSAMAPGENYSSIMIRVNVDVALKNEGNGITKSTDSEAKNGNKTSYSFMIKVAHDNELVQKYLERVNGFHIESNTLRNLLPKFEDLFKSVGINVRFGAKAYILPKNPDGNYVLMDDLGTEGYKCASRTECLDMAHVHLVLKKLAQYHAASATYKANNGPYAKNYMNAFTMDDTHINIWIPIMNGFKEGFMKNIKLYRDAEKYAPGVLKYFETLDSQYQTLYGCDDADGFNVLSHGDCWTSNMLFKYSDNEEVEDVIFVDFQLPNWSSPIKDVMYFIITSIKNDIKLKNFDYYLHYYHEHLVTSLKILNYPNEIPTLRWLHTQSIKYGGYATIPSMLTLPIILYDSSKDSQIDNLIGNDDAGLDFKVKLFANPRYITHFNDLLPWLYNRGCFNN